MKDETWTLLLKHALAPTEVPPSELNEKILSAIQNTNQLRIPRWKRWPAAMLAAIIFLLISTTALAVSQLLSSGQVAEEAGRHSLAEAFESKGSIPVNESAVSGGYRFTLLGLVSGTNLEEIKETDGKLNTERTYAVVSIERQDGNPMPGPQEEDYKKISFFVSPYVKGQKPWLVNAASLGGGYNEFVMDGILYRLIECDGLEMFADRGVYLGISTGTFYSSEAFRFNEETGEIYPAPDYSGASILFPLPLDPAKADHTQAEAYLQAILPPAVKPSEQPRATEHPDYIGRLKAQVAEGETIPDSVKTAVRDSKGWISYSYDGWDFNAPESELFAEGQTGMSDSITFSGDKDGLYIALVFTKDDSGTITGKVVKLKERPLWPV
ncbi:hypothetical protein D3C75_593130 [compost metagenome]